MSKYTFRMKDRMKLVLDKPSANSCSLIVSGKTDIEFRFSKAKARELVACLKSCSTYGLDYTFEFKKTLKSQKGSVAVSMKDNAEDYLIQFTHGDKNKVILEEVIHKKLLKKIYKTMMEVYGVE